MTRFFKDMPTNMRTNGTWIMQVIAVFPRKDSVTYEATYTGKKWVAYLKIRYRALLKDWSTAGEHYGIAWYLEEESIHGQKGTGY